MSKGRNVENTTKVLGQAIENSKFQRAEELSEELFGFLLNEYMHAEESYRVAKLVWDAKTKQRKILGAFISLVPNIFWEHTLVKIKALLEDSGDTLPKLDNQVRRLRRINPSGITTIPPKRRRSSAISNLIQRANAQRNLMIAHNEMKASNEIKEEDEHLYFEELEELLKICRGYIGDITLSLSGIPLELMTDELYFEFQSEKEARDVLDAKMTPEELFNHLRGE